MASELTPDEMKAELIGNEQQLYDHAVAGFPYEAWWVGGIINVVFRSLVLARRENRELKTKLECEIEQQETIYNAGKDDGYQLGYDEGKSCPQAPGRLPQAVGEASTSKDDLS